MVRDRYKALPEEEEKKRDWGRYRYQKHENKRASKKI